MNLAEQYPEKVVELTRVAEKAREDIGDYDRIGKHARFFEAGPRRSDMAQWVE